MLSVSFASRYRLSVVFGSKVVNRTRLDRIARIEEEVLAQRSGEAEGRSARWGHLALPWISGKLRRRESHRCWETQVRRRSVVGRDERPRSSAGDWLSHGHRGWLKPPPPEDVCWTGFTGLKKICLTPV